MRRFTAWFLMSLPSCGVGHASAPLYGVSDVAEAPGTPAGYVSGESIAASCSRATMSALSSEVTLDEVDCSPARMTRVLRAKAGELSAPLIVEKRCHAAKQSVRCSARVARATASAPLVAPRRPDAPAPAPLVAPRRPDAPAPAPAEVLDLDEPRPQDGAEIQVSFVPSHPLGAFSPRDYDEVAETHLPAVGRRELGEASARCESCDPAALRFALRATAGRAGAGEISNVRCVVESRGQRCVAVALEPWSF